MKASLYGAQGLFVELQLHQIVNTPSVDISPVGAHPANLSGWLDKLKEELQTKGFSVGRARQRSFADEALLLSYAIPVTRAGKEYTVHCDLLESPVVAVRLSCFEAQSEIAVLSYLMRLGGSPDADSMTWEQLLGRMWGYRSRLQLFAHYLTMAFERGTLMH